MKTPQQTRQGKPRPANRSEHGMTIVMSVTVILLAGLLLNGCGFEPVNSLQDAVDTTVGPMQDSGGSGAPHPGRIANQEVKGDWAYVRTEGLGVVGHGELVVVDTPQGRKWTILSFATFQIDGKRLKLVQIELGGNLAQQKKKTLDKMLSDLAAKKWSEYLQSQGLTIAKPGE